MTETAGEQWEKQFVLTVEMALYGLILILALALRLFALGRWPLLEQEASLALAAWRFARGIPTPLRGHSPLLFHLNTLLFFLTDGSDSQARLWCVLVGSLIVLLPYGLRRHLGRIGALAAAVLLALSPSFTYFSRAVDGSVIVAFAALGLLVAFTGYLEERRPVYIVAMVVLATVALMAGPSAYTVFALCAAFPVFMLIRARITKDRAPLDVMHTAWREALADASAWRWALTLAGLLFLVFGLAFLYNPLGLQLTLDQLGQWVGGFVFLGQSPWYRILLLLLFYETLTLFLGLVGFFLGRKRGDMFALLLRYWALFAFLFSIVPGYRPPSSVLLLLVPLILAAGQAFEKLWQGLQSAAKEPLFWVLVILSLIVLASAYVQLVSYLAVSVSVYLLRIAALCVFVISAYALFWSIGGPEVPLRAAAFFLLLLLSFVLIRTEVRLNYIQARDPREPMVGTTISPEVLELAQKAAEFSSHLQGDPKVMPWQVDERLEIPLGWYLRHFEQVSYVSRVTAEPQGVGVILPAGAPAPAKYVGLHFDLRSAWLGGKYPLLEWLRWWLGLKSGLPAPQAEEVVLWVRGAVGE
ncbi:MAG: glycosyltransferase family 39 protein [Chloroflexi bacterium]|nr:glycosyltransferase family 39 protein [Chloroflexota bacterium]